MGRGKRKKKVDRSTAHFRKAREVKRVEELLDFLKLQREAKSTQGREKADTL